MTGIFVGQILIRPAGFWGNQVASGAPSFPKPLLVGFAITSVGVLNGPKGGLPILLKGDLVAFIGVGFGHQDDAMSAYLPNPYSSTGTS